MSERGLGMGGGDEGVVMRGSDDEGKGVQGCCGVVETGARFLLLIDGTNRVSAPPPAGSFDGLGHIFDGLGHIFGYGPNEDRLSGDHSWGPAVGICSGVTPMARGRGEKYQLLSSSYPQMTRKSGLRIWSRPPVACRRPR